jgi:hypothetical protein
MSKAKEIQCLEAKLKEHPNMMVIPTDKTNSYKVIDKEKYIEWVLDHLKTDTIEVSADKLVKIHEEGNELLSKLGNTLSEKENGLRGRNVRFKSSSDTQTSHQGLQTNE